MLNVSSPAEHVRLVQIDRPEARNALSTTLLSSMGAQFRGFEADEAVRVVVLTGDEKAFSAGADIKEMTDGGIPMWGQTDRLAAWKTIERFSKPLIAAANGYVLGGGLELMLLCDIAVVGNNARLGFPEVKIGAFPGDGGTQRAPRAIGKARAMWMMMTGDLIDAATACAWGLASEMSPPHDTVARALEIAVKIAGMSPIAERMIKEEILMTFEKPLDESLSLERKLRLWQTEDHLEGIAAFREKRQPRYTGR